MTTIKDFLPSITGSFAQPAAENPTVAMVEAAYRHHGLHFRYLNCEVSPDQLKEAVAGARAMNWAGFNCSIPHKVSVIPYLDGLGESAKLIGAVNTIVNREGKWIGENTDGKGFVKALREVTDPAGKRIMLFGAGGAARAVAVELALAGAAHLTVVNRSRDRGQEVAELIRKNTNADARYEHWTQNYAIIPGTDVVINATSVGLYPDIDARLDINFDSITPEMVVADGIHNPPLTQLLRTAAGKGCRTVNGLNMLVNQGVIGIRYWTGMEVDPAVMYRALQEVLNIK